jgi:hypothetical protein
MRRLLMTTFFVLSSLSASGGERWKELPPTPAPIRSASTRIVGLSRYLSI